MHDFTTADPEKIYNEVLKERITDVKQIGKDGKSKMCKKLDDLVKKERKEERETIAKKMHENGLSDEMIAKCVNEPPEKIKAWLR